MVDVRLDFGKYRGHRLEDVPFSYLSWCLRECDNLDPWLRRAIERELDGRCRGSGRREASAGGSVAAWEPVIRDWYRALAFRYHPDRGGSTEAMQVVNAAHDELRKLVGVA